MVVEDMEVGLDMAVEDKVAEDREIVLGMAVGDKDMEVVHRVAGDRHLVGHLVDLTLLLKEIYIELNIFIFYRFIKK